MFGNVRARRNVLAVMALSMTIIGCGGGVDDATRFGKTGKVKGKVSYSGNAVKEARVQFSSKDTGAAVIGNVQDGEFVMTDPVPVGNYKVAVMTPQEAAPDSGVAYQPKEYPDIPLKYRDEFNTDLTAEVKEGENEFKFDMKP